MKRSISETQVAAAVVAWLQDMRWDVYQEVSFGYGDRTIDIVAMQGSLVWAVECKTSLSMALIAQAYQHLPYAHRVSIAYPGKGRDKHGRLRFKRAEDEFQRAVVKEFGIGTFEIKDDGMYRKDGSKVWVAERIIEPQFRRKIGNIYENATYYRSHGLGLERNHTPRSRDAYPMLRDLLTEKQKTFAMAGNNLGRHWSPWRETCEAVREFVVEHPGCSIKECLTAVKHHYQSQQSAIGSMRHWVRAGKIDGVEERMSDKGWIEWWPRENVNV